MQSFDGTLMSQITPPSSRLQSTLLDQSKPPPSIVNAGTSTPVLRGSYAGGSTSSRRRSTDQNNNNGGVFQLTNHKSASMSSSVHPPGVMCRVFVPNVGWGSQLTNGEVLVQYTDGTELTITSDPMLVKFTTEHGKTSQLVPRATCVTIYIYVAFFRFNLCKLILPL